MTWGELYVLALQLGMQYLIPAAVLLRALYFSLRGRMPEGVRDIFIAGLIAGVGALMDGDASDMGEALLEVAGNAVFISGLLIFIVVYLLRLPYLGHWVDGIVGGFIGLVAWLAWVYLLGNDWPLYTGPAVAVAGSAAFIGLRSLLRRLGALMQLARRLVIIGLILAAVGGVIWLLQGAL
ncbi:MAG: hypothetical protein ACOCXZ_02555 [Chloroflexota bacterium]